MGALQPHPLTVDERGVLTLLLSRDLLHVAILREQAQLVTVVGRCECGCPSVDLAVPDEVPAVAHLADGLLPVEGVAPAVPAPLEIICFVAAGRLSYLELVYYGDPPTSWPGLESITLRPTV